MKVQIQIADPCNKNWNAMIPNNDGRHCLQCCKTVIDFTDWEPEKILDYIKENKNICGRIYPQQMIVEDKRHNLISNIINSSLAYWKKIAAIVIICFAVAADTSAQTQQHTPQKTKTHVVKKPVKTPKQSPIMGLVAPPKKNNIDSIKRNDTASPPSTQIMGKIKVVTPKPPSQPQPLMGDVKISSPQANDKK